MSNLIDRRAAIKVASKECYELRGVFGRIEEGLNELPTVEAIPVVWIEKWMAYWARILPDWGAFEVCAAMLKDWEKENGID